MKRLVAGLLVLILLLSAYVAICSATEVTSFREYRSGQFADVKETDWFAPGVRSAYEIGLMNGSGENTFKPDGNLTVGEALAIACRLHSLYTADGESFTQGNPWYQVYVDYAVANKIMAAGQLDPTKQATREQFAYLMCGAVPESELPAINTVTEIPDEPEKSTYGGFVYRLYRAGVLTGSDKYGTFKPTTGIRRSEVATIVTRLADKTQRKTFTLEKLVLPTEVQLAGVTSIMVGQSTTWTAKLLPAGSVSAVTWTAGNPGVATVDQNGKITGHKAGDCHITATASNGVKKTVMVHVRFNARDAYQPIISDCARVCRESIKKNHDFGWYDEWVIGDRLVYPGNPREVRYRFYDINRDGIEELLFENDERIFALFSFDGQKAILIDSWTDRGSAHIYSSGIIMTTYSIVGVGWNEEYYKLEAGSGKQIWLYSYSFDAEKTTATEEREHEDAINKLQLGSEVTFDRNNSIRVLQ